jgi:hypothetical protein
MVADHNRFKYGLGSSWSPTSILFCVVLCLVGSTQALLFKAGFSRLSIQFFPHFGDFFAVIL